MWSVCLIGWTGSVLLPDGARLPPAPAGAATAAPVLDAAERRSPAASLIRQVQDRRAAFLQADLDAALALRTAQAHQLAEIPRRLDGLPNPIHQRSAIQLHQQDALIASLRLRLAAVAARAADVERRAHGPSGRIAGPSATAAPLGGVAPPPSADPPTALSAPSGPARTAAAVPRAAVLCGVLLLGAAAGAALAAWRGRSDGIIDHPSQLRQRLPVLCAIDLPAAPEHAGCERASRRRAVLAALGLLGLLAGLVVAERTGALATLRQGLVARWPG